MTRSTSRAARREMAPIPDGHPIPGAPQQTEPKGLTQAEIRQIVLELLG